MGDLNKHLKRKTPCDPIKGDPTKKAALNMCIYCRKQLSGKQSLTRHYIVCAIKNNGMSILFEKVKHMEIKHANEIKKLTQKVKDLECKKVLITGQTTNSHNINTDNSNNIGVQNNHNNTTLNFNITDFGGGVELIKTILQGQGLQLLENKFTNDVPLVQQISDRVVNLVGLVFRNPDHKELQSIYVIDPDKLKENAYYHDEGKWVLGDWNTLRTQLLQDLYFHYNSIKNKNDAEGIMKLIFKLSMDKLDSSMTREETAAVLTDIGNYLKFDTIVL
jgi:hypothetical protein